MSEQLDELNDILDRALRSVLPEVEALGQQYTEPWIVWKRTGSSNWSGETEFRPDRLQVMMNARPSLVAHSAPLREYFTQNFPGFMSRLGIRGSSFGEVAGDQTYPFCQVLDAYWRQAGSYEIGDQAIAAVIASVRDVLASGKVGCRFTAIIRNLRSASKSVCISPTLTVRELNDEELTSFYGGSHSTLVHARRTIYQHAIDGHAFVGQRDAQVIFKVEDLSERSHIEAVRDELDEAVLAIHGVKDGPIGFDTIHFEPSGFTPVLGTSSISPLHRYIPLGGCDVNETEWTQVSDVLAKLRACPDTALRFAFRRLSDAQTRLKPEDAILDAVTGLESILLSSIEKPEDRGEKSFRCSLHFALLEDSPAERLTRFRAAKDLYGHRSTIAHGDVLGGKLRVGKYKHLTPAEVARFATQALRSVLLKLLDDSRDSHYRSNEYWYERYFGKVEVTGQKAV